MHESYIVFKKFFHNGIQKYFMIFASYLPGQGFEPCLCSVCVELDPCVISVRVEFACPLCVSKGISAK